MSIAIDYLERGYLSVGEVANYTGLPVNEIHALVKSGRMQAFKSASGQYRFRLEQIQEFRKTDSNSHLESGVPQAVEVNGTTQAVICGDSRRMRLLGANSVHLAITSPPYFDAKMYSASQAGDLGNIHQLERWFREISKVWAEVYRVLQPGRKFFLNIMNLPVRSDNSFRTLNLVGKSIDQCEKVGFIFKRDIVWHKTNGVRAHFGTYPYPGGILINNMHEFILEFDKPAAKGTKKYKHLSARQREESQLDKEFWLSVKNSDVWLIKPEKSGGNRDHSAPFPLELPARLIRAFSYIGETVLDPFAGSGTTSLAAAHLKRNGVGIDINADFCNLALKRLSEVLV